MQAPNLLVRKVRQDLFHIPHELFGVSIFGPGWLLILWAVVSIAVLLWLWRRQGWNAETRSYIPVLLIVGAVIWLVLPRLESRALPPLRTNGGQSVDTASAAPDDQPAVGQPIGLPIRGYGVMLLLAVVSGVALAAREGRRGGLDPEVVFSCAFYVFLGGILGARLFFVIEYWPQFQRETLAATIGAILNVTQGGLVVYGSLIGGASAGIGYLYAHRLPILAIADLAAPSLLLGLAIGRIGCLLNGCCHGGICHDQRLGITFPKDSPPYIQQCELGEMHGFRIAESSTSGSAVVDKVEPSGPAAVAGLSRGAVIQSINGIPVESYVAARMALRALPAELFVETDRGMAHIRLEKIPDRSRPVHPTQIYSSINAGLLCLLLWAFYPLRRRDGEVFALALLLYPITRILLEFIRTDEPGQLGTSLTVSQILSLVLFATSILLWIYILRRPRGTALPVATDEASATTA